MNEISPEAFDLALAACAAEPIHQLGAIQPHGAVVVFTSDEKHTIIQVSANLEQFLDCCAEAALGQTLYNCLGSAAAHKIEALLKQPNTEPSTSTLLAITRQQQCIELNATLYTAKHYWILELTDTTPSTEPLAERLLSLQQSLTFKKPSAPITHYFEQITPILRELSGYDSVMVYRFSSENDGQVIAQSKTEPAPSYLGLHFPAGDIPSQARALYTKNLVRYVANIADSRINLVPSLNPLTQQPLDMTYLSLRSLSPVHIEYLVNMAVSATLTLSLLQDGQLWGLIIFHHLSPKKPSSDLLKLMQFVSRQISTELLALALRDEKNLLSKITYFKKSLLKAILHHSEEHLIDRLSTNLMDVGNATGLIIVINGQRYTRGLTPNAVQIDKLLSWLSQQPEPEPEPEPRIVTYTYTFNKLSATYPAASAYRDIAAGLLACALNKDMNYCLIWLKKADLTQKLWAGDPTKRLIKTANGEHRLRPRNSFESLQINNLDSCTPSAMLEIKAVHELSITLIKTLAYKFTLQQTQTAKQKLKNALIESEQLWKYAIDGIGDGVYDWHIQINDMYYSPRWKTMLGYNEEDILTEYDTWEKLIHPDYFQATTRTLQAYLAGSIPSYEVEIPLLTKRGDYLWILSRGTIVSRDNQGQPLRMIGTHIDISERKLIELNLKEDRNTLALSQRIANLGNWSYTPSTDTLDWSAQTYLIYGVNKAEFGHNLRAITELIHPEDQILVSTWRFQLTQPLANNQLIFRIVRPNGEQRHIKTFATIEYTVDGQVSRLVGCSQDVTEQILSEQQDQIHLDQLAHITRLGLMGEMATGIAHEVNQPLTAATNYASALKILATAEHPDVEKIAKIAGLVAEQTLRAGKIIHRMKAFCQNQDTTSTSTNINTLIKDCIVLCNNDFKKHNVTLKLELADSLPMLLVDSIKIEQVLINLIRNSTEALSAQDNPTKTITLSSLMLDENQLQIQVRDNGSGIEQALQEKLFMPFVTTKTEGMGMGLSICRSLIVAHRGTLTFDSQLGLGTCFYITLPIPENLE